MSVANRLGMNYTVDTMVNESLIPRGRNSLVAKFLAFEPKSTHLMFIDADIGFEPEEIIKLVLADKDIVGGIYPKKSLPIQYVVNKVADGKQSGDFLREVANIGTGFMLIKRGVFDRIIREKPDLHYMDQIGLDKKFDPFKYLFFDMTIDSNTRELLSEDYHFCKMWRDMGGEIWADLSIKLDHSGYYKFQGDATQLKDFL
jgi:hypothetical protein